jgi:hypothetical protein
VDVQALGVLALGVKPKIISIGGSLNLFEHPVAEIRSIADAAGARVLFDAAHQCGLIAGNPLDHGAHVMTMSTYKSLGGPVGGLVLTNESDLAQRLDVIAFPGMTANFVATKSAALGNMALGMRHRWSKRHTRWQSLWCLRAFRSSARKASRPPRTNLRSKRRDTAAGRLLPNVGEPQTCLLAVSACRSRP